MDRRRFLRSGLAATLMLAPAATARAQATAPILPPRQPYILGRSQGDRALVLYRVGSGKRRVLVVGGQHGSPEANAVDVAEAALIYFMRTEASLPRGVGLDVLALANPDGFVAGSRQYRSGVDPNRNWGSSDWQPDAYDSLGRPIEGLGGAAPWSEPETLALGSWIYRQRPAVVVNYHSAGGFVSTRQGGLSAELAAVYAEAAGYHFYGPESEPFGYAVTGAMDAWLEEVGIADIFVELTTPTDAEIGENLAGLVAVLQHLGS